MSRHYTKCAFEITGIFFHSKLLFTPKVRVPLEFVCCCITTLCLHACIAGVALVTGVGVGVTTLCLDMDYRLLIAKLIVVIVLQIIFVE